MKKRQILGQRQNLNFYLAPRSTVFLFFGMNNQVRRRGVISSDSNSLENSEPVENLNFVSISN